MRLADLDAVLPLEQDLFAGDPPWTAEVFRSELAEVPATRWYVVAERSADDLSGSGPTNPQVGKLSGRTTRMIVGYAGLRLPAAFGEPADVHTIAVVPDHQRGGLGSRLLGVLIDEAKAHGAGSITLEVRADNAAALAFYAKHGFEQIAVRRGYFGGRRDGLVMRRPMVIDDRERHGVEDGQ